jgi:hypothetical protein
MSKYLLTVREQIGDHYESLNNVLVRATGPGYAKYHWHKLMNQHGASKDGEHEYTDWDSGLTAELESVRKVSDEELEVLEDVLVEIPGFDP